MIVDIEGIDGSGKATQAKLLSQRIADLLYEEGKTIPKDKRDFRGCGLISFPCYKDTTFGPFIKRYLKGKYGSLYDNHPFLVSLMYSLDRFEMLEQIKHLRENCKDLLVFDRYVPSNIAHQAAKFYTDDDELRSKWQNLARDIETVEYDVLKLPRPDIVIYLDLTAEQSYKRTHARDTEEDLHQDNRKYLDAVRRVYLHYANTYKGWHIVHCFDSDGRERTPQEIHEEIFEIFTQAREAMRAAKK